MGKLAALGVDMASFGGSASCIATNEYPTLQRWPRPRSPISSRPSRPRALADEQRRRVHRAHSPALPDRGCRQPARGPHGMASPGRQPADCETADQGMEPRRRSPLRTPPKIAGLFGSRQGTAAREPVRHRTQRRHPASSTRRRTSARCCARLMPVLERHRARPGRSCSSTTAARDGTLAAMRGANAARPAHRRRLLQPQLRQGDRHRRRARPCARATPS